MNVAVWAVRWRTLVVLITVCSVIAGLWAASTLPSGIYPEMEFPRISVVVQGGGTTPELFSTTVTRPLEQALLGVLGVTRLRSKTLRGGAELAVLFSPKTDMWRALQQVNAAVADVKNIFPKDVRVLVERVTPVAFPIYTLNLSGSLDLRDLRDLADYVIRPALIRVKGVGRVSVEGGKVREMEVVVDPSQAASRHLSLQDIVSRLRDAIQLQAVGYFSQYRGLTTMVADAEAQDMHDISSVPISMDAQGVPIALGTLAEVFEGAEDTLVRTTGPKGDAVLISVARMEGESTSQVVKNVAAAMQSLAPSLPAGVVVEPVYDQGFLVDEALGSVRDAVLLGCALCLVVLAIFLRDIRSGLTAALAVPITLIATFVAMQLAGQTLNLMSMGGMAVAVGLVVDDAIVVVEAIARRLEEKLPVVQAVYQGTQSMAAAVTGTTVTTAVVFVPLAFLEGVVGKFFSVLAFTLCAAVGLSWLVSLFVVPLAAIAWMRPISHKRAPSSWIAVYGRLVRRVAPKLWLGPLVSVLAVAFAWIAVGQVPSGFMPTADEGAFVLDYFAPSGSSLEEVDHAAGQLEQMLIAMPEVATFSRRTGAGLNAAEAPMVNKGDFIVRLKPAPRRDVEQIVADLRQQVEEQVPQLRCEFIQLMQDMLNDLSGAPRPLEIKILGEDVAVLQHIAQQLAEKLRDVPGLVDLYDGIESRSPELVARIDRDKVARLSLTPAALIGDLKTALHGDTVAGMRHLDRLINIRVRYPDKVRFAADQMAEFPIGAGRAGTIDLESVAKLSPSSSATILWHEGMQPVIIMTADHEGVDLGRVVLEVRKHIAQTAMPPGYRIEMGGQIENQQQAQRHLLNVSLAGLLLVLMVLVVQFGRLAPSLAVLLTAPLALVGAFGTLWITSTALNASSMMGCVLLVGLVVKNGILLLETAEDEWHAGHSYLDALATAAERRLRPIAMTTLATLVGLLPLALGAGPGAQLQRPLAYAVIGGLSVAASLSLLTLPSLALGLHQLSLRLSRQP